MTSDGLTILVVDDEPLARQFLGKLLNEDNRVKAVTFAGNVTEALVALSQKVFDIVFLDIQMPGRDGFDLISEVGVSEMPVTVFVTAFDQFALKAFDAAAVDYLLKPFNRERFDQSMERAVIALNGQRTRANADTLETLLQKIGERLSPDGPTRFIVKDAGRIRFIQAQDVLWLQAAGNYVEIHTASRTALVRGTLGEMEQKLSLPFTRIHRSTIVNLDFIEELSPLFHGDYVVKMTNGAELKLSRSFKESLDKICS